MLVQPTDVASKFSCFFFGDHPLGLLILGLPASAEEIAGQWHALFDTPAGMQTYHFDFQNKDGKLTAKAVVESADQKRDVEFEEAELDGDTLTRLVLSRQRFAHFNDGDGHFMAQSGRDFGQVPIV